MLPQLMVMQIRRVCQHVIWSIRTHKSQKTVFLLCLLDCFIPFGVTGRVHIWAKARSTLGWVASSSHGPLCEHLWVWCLVQEKQLLTFKNISSAPTQMKGALSQNCWRLHLIRELLAPWIHCEKVGILVNNMRVVNLKKKNTRGRGGAPKQNNSPSSQSLTRWLG